MVGLNPKLQTTAMHFARSPSASRDNTLHNTLSQYKI